MLRLGNWFRYQGTANFDSAPTEIVANANRVLGHPVPVYMSSWSPPAFLKSDGQVGNGGTVVYTNSAMTLRPSGLGSSVNNYIGQSQYPDPYFDGLIDEFHIYGMGIGCPKSADWRKYS